MANSKIKMHNLLIVTVLLGLVLGLAISASATITLLDPLDGSNLGIASSLYADDYTSGVFGQSAIFNSGADYIRYNYDLFPLEGTISFYVKLTASWSTNHLILSGRQSPLAIGDIVLQQRADNTLDFEFYNGTNWMKRVHSCTVFEIGRWYHVAVSYGSEGMKLFIDGVQEQAMFNNYTGSRSARAMHFGDNNRVASSWCYIDQIVVSDIQSDPELLKIFPDRLDGENFGKSSQGIDYDNGWCGDAAVLDNVEDNICYDSCYFPSEGTVSFYIKPETNEQYRTIFANSSETAAAGDVMLLLSDSTNKLLYKIYDGSQWIYIEGLTPLEIGKWYHVAVSYGSDGTRLYVDGKEDVSDISCIAVPNNNDIYVGKNSNVQAPSFLGAIDHIDSSNIQSDPLLTKNLPDTLDGSSLGKSIRGISYDAGFDGQAAVFDTDGDIIGYDTSYFPTEGTISCYVKLNNNQGVNRPILKVGDSRLQTGDMSLVHLAETGKVNKLRFSMYDGTAWTPRIESSAALNLEQWYLVTISYGSDGMKLYLNGELEGSYNYTVPRSNRDMLVGYDPSISALYGHSLYGSIDHLRSSPIQSDPSLLDYTAPSTPIVEDGGDYQNWTTALYASWSASDNESGITDYQYAVGTTAFDPGHGYLVDWTSAGTSTSFDLSDLSLENGITYYVYVKAKNGNGIWSNVGVSNGIGIDTVAPQIGLATAGVYTNNDSPSVSYSGATDDYSGINHIELYYKCGAHGDWTYCSSSNSLPSGSFDVDLPSSGIYYFDLVSVDNAGNCSDWPSGDGDCSTIYEPEFGNSDPTGRIVEHIQYLYPGGPAIASSVFSEGGSQKRQVINNYGKEGELLSVGGDADSVSYAYNALYQVKSISDGNGNATTYTYDDDGNPNNYDPKLGLLNHVQYPGGDTVQFTKYDDAGRVLELIDPNGTTIQYSYSDIEDLPTDIIYPAIPSQNVHFSYDSARGLLTQIQDGSGTRNFSYDNRNVPITETITYAGLPAKSMSYQFYPDGSLMTMTTPAGDFDYTYDAVGRPVGLQNPLSEAFSWGYLDNDWLQCETSPVSTASYDYNTRGLLTSLENKKADQTLLSQYTIPTDITGYDTTGNLLTVTANIPDVDSRYSGITTYAYNTLDKLILEQSTRNQNYSNSFVYDSAGNPTTFKGLSKNFNQKNQNTAFTFDSNGNPTSYNVNTLTYDAENRLTSFGSVMTAGYTSDGLRAWKETSSGRTYYLYSGSTPVLEMNSTGTVTAVNTFGPNGLLSRRTGGSDALYTFDPQGNAVETLDSSGNLTSTQLYDSYGSLLYGTSSSPYGFCAKYGYYTDQETGLQLLTHRYYDPAEGQFITRDPIGYAGGLNLYAYCNGNPVNAEDPSGFDELWYDNTARDCSQRAQRAKDAILDSNMGVIDKTITTSAIDIWNGFMSMPAALGHLGEGLGCWAGGDHSTETACRAWDDVGVFSSTVLAVSLGPAMRGLSVAPEPPVAEYNLETHHLYPRQFEKFFGERGISIDDYTIDLPEELHRLKSGQGLHTNQSGPKTNWNAEWEKFIGENRYATAEQCENQLHKMLDDFGVAEKLGRY